MKIEFYDKYHSSLVFLNPRSGEPFKFIKTLLLLQDLIKYQIKLPRLI